MAVIVPGQKQTQHCQPAWEVPPACGTGGGSWGGAEGMGVAGCRRGQWLQGLSGHFISLGNQRKVLGAEPAVLGQGRDVVKHVFHSACCKRKGTLEGGQ